MSSIDGIAAIQYRAALASLISANRQPELALQLIQQTTQSLAASSKLQSSPAPVEQPATSRQDQTSSPSDTGQIIDVIV